MTLREKQTAFAAMLGKLLCKAPELGTPVLILEMHRSLETQKAYVARGASKTLNSKHLEGLAVDLVFLEDLKDDGKINYSPEKYKSLGEYWENLGGRWGGRFGDNLATEKIEGWDSGHFEYAG
ncbi:MAG TPA: M15 family metallopeptidase [Thermodesulfobacteriota bacterium]|nr:M15 family metallopeptidase [Thermodesulfobacteriota bacterium]